MDKNIKKGAEVIQAIWFSMTQRIVNRVIEIVGANEEQAKILREMYLVAGSIKLE
jgi:hypothetical protein